MTTRATKTRILGAVILGLVSLTLTGCDPQNLTPAQMSAVCHAMVGPIRYTSTNKLSKRYAAILLSLDLKQRNQIYTGLGCAYRR